MLKSHRLLYSQTYTNVPKLFIEYFIRLLNDNKLFCSWILLFASQKKNEDMSNSFFPHRPVTKKKHEQWLLSPHANNKSPAVDLHDIKMSSTRRLSQILLRLARQQSLNIASIFMVISASQIQVLLGAVSILLKFFLSPPEIRFLTQFQIPSDPISVTTNT